MKEPDTARRALPLLDLTSLNDDDDDAAVDRLCARATGPYGRVAAVCVWPRFIARCRDALAGSGVHIAAVANFPAGALDTAGAVAEVRAAAAAGADEVDLVWPYAAWLDGQRAEAGELVAACKAACGAGRILKVILESGRLRSPENIAAASRDAIAAGADFIKTSTGKTEVSATLEAAEIMLAAIEQSGHSVGFKAAGGIRTTAQAGAYLALADRILGPGWAAPETFRFGASGLLDDLLAKLGGADPPGPSEQGY
jgi:deoxyribose-phosphate aldolase